MVCRKFYYNLVIRILLIAFWCLLLFGTIFFYPNISLIAIFFLVFLFQVLELIRYLNKTNRKLEDFFVAHLSGEVTTQFIKSKKEEEFFQLYQYFEEINTRLENIRVENEIRNNYFKIIVDHAAVGLISFTPDGKVEFFNDAAKRLFGVHVVKHLSKLNQFKEGLCDHLINLSSNQPELIPIIINGELRQLATRKVQFVTEDKTIHLVSIQNIKPELEQKEVESWQRLIRVLTHEIMNSITPITSLVSSMIRLFRDKETGSPKKPSELTEQMVEKTLKGLDLVEGRGNGLVQFVNNYREITKLPKPNFQVVNVKEMLDQVVLFMEANLAGKNIRMIVDCHPSVIFQADLVLIQQVLINLVKNAIEAFGDTPEPLVRLRGQSIQDQTIIEIEDNGKGIPPEVLEDIFVPFFTTKEKGSGIGLSLSRQIVRLHGGSLDAQSTPGLRTVFTIKI